jgi:hypothetical protein
MQHFLLTTAILFARLRAMAVHLKDRNTQIPNGLTYYLPQTKWRSRSGSSFRGITEALYYHLQGNPAVLKQLGWPLDMTFIGNKVDEFNAKLCESQGWMEFIAQGEPGGGRVVPFPFQFPAPGVLDSLKRVAAGPGALVEWINSGSEAVIPEVSERRAGICAGCSANQPGNFFVQAVSEAIRKAENNARTWQLRTSKDADLKTCAICLCPLRLKVHIPIDKILGRLEPEVRSELPPHCWILTESK